MIDCLKLADVESNLMHVFLSQNVFFMNFLRDFIYEFLYFMIFKHVSI